MSFDGPAFANVLCLVGWLGYIEDLMSCASGAYDPDGDPHAEFPGWIPPATGKKTTIGADPDFRGMTGFTIKQIAAAVEDRLDDCAKKIEKGSYVPDAPFKDMARGYTQLLRDGAAVADAGIRSVGLTMPRISRRGDRPLRLPIRRPRMPPNVRWTR